MVVSGRSRLPLIISVCFAGVMGVGAFGILAWVTGQLAVAQINPLYVPIAPLATLILVLLGISWCLFGVRPEYSWFRIQAGVVGLLVVMLTSLVIHHDLRPGTFSIETLIFPNHVTLRGYLLVEMSPIAAVMLFLGGLSLILLVSSSVTRTRTSVALFGIVILSCGVVVSIGYLYRAPLLYGSILRPVSVLAGIAFLFLGIEIWAAAGRECWPTRNLVGDSVQARLLRSFLPIVALILVTLLSIDEILGQVYLRSLVTSLLLLGGLVAVIVSVARLSHVIGSEIDQGTAELGKSEEMYRRLFDSSQEGIIILDAETKKIVDVNPFLQRLSGYSSEQIVGKELLEIESFKDVKGQIDFEELRKREFIRIEPLPIKTKEKESINVEFFSSVFEHDGRRMIQCNIRDITEQLSLQEKLRSHNENLEELLKQRTKNIDLARQYAENIVSTVRDPLVVLDSDLRIVSASRSFYENFKADPTDTEGKSLYELGNRQWDNPELRRLLTEILPAKSVINDFELIHVFPTIGQRMMLLNARKVRAELGREPFILLAIEDITERKQIEKIRDRFISNVTHELRTPLVSIQGYLDLILSGEEISSQTKEDLEVVKRNANVLVRLVDDLLDIQRLASGRVTLDPQPLELRNLIQACIQQVQPLITEKNHKLQLETPDRELTIVGDKTKLGQVLMNMLQNSIKFTPDRGRIIVRVKDEENSVKVQVVDNGMGIRKEDLNRVFEPFSAISKSTYIKGTGLGMSVARGLVQAHGGRIWAESEGEGKGATFTFTLPKRKELGDVTERKRMEDYLAS